LPDGTYIFKPKIPIWVKFWGGLAMPDVGVFMAILSIIRSNGIVFSYLVHFVAIWYNFSRFGMLYRQKSGNPDL
jgi:hypothetical protein